jgi:hypothetical protein
VAAYRVVRLAVPTAEHPTHATSPAPRYVPTGHATHSSCPTVLVKLANHPTGHRAVSGDTVDAAVGPSIRPSACVAVVLAAANPVSSRYARSAGCRVGTTTNVTSTLLAAVMLPSSAVPRA